MTSTNTSKVEAFGAALKILGDGYPHPTTRLAEALLDAAAEALLLELDDSHPDHPEECAKLMAEVEAAVEAREELPRPVEGWEYWFGARKVFTAYEAALEMVNAE